jgi:hypothetical protein
MAMSRTFAAQAGIDKRADHIEAGVSAASAATIVTASMPMECALTA